ncbi:hypothetical protein C8R46DRAFT_1221711 [Mycena filopes]|nr:hypothetical protein C8R46DRAFT_1221711 [Mycena filopes]
MSQPLSTAYINWARFTFNPTPHTLSNKMSTTTTSIVPSATTARRGSLRERCGFTLWLSFAPALPNIRAKGHLGPTAANLPRRKRSSVVSLDLEPPSPVVVDARAEYFA